MAGKFIYVVQFGACWRLTQDQWIELCRQAVTNGGSYNLDEVGGKQLSRLPVYWKVRSDVRKPLDWEVGDFAYEANHLMMAR